MAYTETSDSIIIRATLTEKGKKLLARGKFKVAKFALGDDEVDYRLYNSFQADSDSGYKPALKNTLMIEALKDTSKNIHFGLNSYDSGILYLTESELTDLGERTPHAFITYLPQLVKNTRTSYSPTVKDNKFYVSVNDETTKLLTDNVAGLKFLETNDYEKTKIVVESGILVPKDSGGDFLGLGEMPLPTRQDREDRIVKKFLLDEDMIVNADNRLIQNIIGIQQTSQFENYISGDYININFNTELIEAPAVSIESGFDYYATFLLKCIPNLIVSVSGASEYYDEGTSVSNVNGPRGSVTAFNLIVDNQLKVNSTGERDSRFSEFGTINATVFSEMPTRKFDYIDTTIYITGATTNSSLQIPIRIIRYAGL